MTNNPQNQGSKTQNPSQTANPSQRPDQSRDRQTTTPNQPNREQR